MDIEKIATAILALAVITGAAILYFSFTAQGAPALENNSQNFRDFSAKQVAGDICAVPPGTDPVQWKEHLGHHPDKYAQCLK